MDAARDGEQRRVGIFAFGPASRKACTPSPRRGSNEPHGRSVEGRPAGRERGMNEHAARARDGRREWEGRGTKAIRRSSVRPSVRHPLRLLLARSPILRISHAIVQVHFEL